jgi:uncharacterized protein (TIGR02599 family)
MVAIDETSAARFCTTSTPPTQITGALAGLFQVSNTTDFDADLDKLTTSLAQNNIQFRVFTSIVPMRESKMQ